MGEEEAEIMFGTNLRAGDEWSGIGKEGVNALARP